MGAWPGYSPRCISSSAAMFFTFLARNGIWNIISLLFFLKRCPAFEHYNIDVARTVNCSLVWVRSGEADCLEWNFQSSEESHTIWCLHRWFFISKSSAEQNSKRGKLQLLACEFHSEIVLQLHSLGKPKSVPAENMQVIWTNVIQLLFRGSLFFFFEVLESSGARALLFNATGSRGGFFPFFSHFCALFAHFF